MTPGTLPGPRVANDRLLVEQRVYSRRHKYAGTLDILGVWQGVGALIDFKTGSPRDVSADLQTAAYYGALLEMRGNNDSPEALTFDPLTHAYFLDGARLPSVTQILGHAGLIDFSKIPGAILQRAKDRGSAVHAAIHYYTEGDLDAAFQTDFPEYWPYLEAYIKFLDESGFEFATESDLPSLTHIRRYALQLKKDASYVVTQYEKASDFAEFLCLRSAQGILDRRRPGAWLEIAEA